MSVKTATKKEDGCRSGTNCQPLGWQNYGGGWGVGGWVRGDRGKTQTWVGIRLEGREKNKTDGKISLHTDVAIFVSYQTVGHILTAPQGDSSRAKLSLTQQHRFWIFSVCFNNMTTPPGRWLKWCELKSKCILSSFVKHIKYVAVWNVSVD